MCSICGIVRFNGEAPDPSDVKRMLGTVRHRGPDGSGLYHDGETALGHARLSIIDLVDGAQPMSNETGSLWLSFNGEIYNFKELRADLSKRGHVFRTSSDSEAIIHAWEEWGPDALGKFNGQWGFALWDRERRRLHLSADPYGIRPVYYSEVGKTFSFASEIKALLAVRGRERSFDFGGIADVYRSWGLVGARTCFEGVKRLLPGSLLTLSPGGMEITQYRPPPLTEPTAINFDDAAEAVREALVEAVNLRFTRSDVPVGAYLSGGLDSSIIVSLITRHTDVELKTFSIRFGDSEYDEGEFQHALSNDLGTNHQSVRVGDAEMMATFPEVVRHTEQPILRTAPIPMYLLSRLVRENGYKVVVTGEGADEFFAGYDIFKETAVRDRILAGAPDSEIAETIGRLYPWMSRSPGSARGMGRSFFERNLDASDPFMSHRTRWDNGAPLMSMLSPDIAPRGTLEASIEIPRDFRNWSPVFRAQWLEIRTLLNGYLLSAQGDRMLMANSVEGRFPFLDPNVTSLANALPDEEKLNGDFVEKAILKEAFGNVIPKRITERPKQPYRAPDANALFSGTPQPWMEEVMSPEFVEGTGFLNTPVVNGLFDKCRQQRGRRMSNRDNMMAIAAVSTLLLHKTFIESPEEQGEKEPDLLINAVC